MESATLIEPQYQDLLLSRLSPEDDQAFWLAAIPVLLQDVEVELEEARPRTEVYAHIGACSHWLRPHQTRWTAAGGFAWPSGYGSSGYSRLGVPEFDWSVLLRRDFETREWQPVAKFASKRHFIFRAALPTRTKRHPQAAIHTTWLPRLPSSGEPKALHLYGFRNIEGDWQCVASR